MLTEHNKKTENNLENLTVFIVGKNDNSDLILQTSNPELIGEIIALSGRLCVTERDI